MSPVYVQRPADFFLPNISHFFRRRVDNETVSARQLVKRISFVRILRGRKHRFRLSLRNTRDLHQSSGIRFCNELRVCSCSIAASEITIVDEVLKFHEVLKVGFTLTWRPPFWTSFSSPTRPVSQRPRLLAPNTSFVRALRTPEAAPGNTAA